MKTLTNSTESDILFVNHQRRNERANQDAWWLATDTGAGGTQAPARVTRAVIQLAAVVVGMGIVLLTGGSVLAATPKVGLTECDESGCLVVTPGDVLAHSCDDPMQKTATVEPVALISSDHMRFLEQNWVYDLRPLAIAPSRSTVDAGDNVRCIGINTAQPSSDDTPSRIDSQRLTDY